MKTNQRPNSELFLDLFSEIEQKLKEQCGDTFHAGFTDLLRKCRVTNPVVMRYYFDLKEYAQLRNAIVHTRRENFIIAEPHHDVVESIKHIRKLMFSPPKISSVMRRNPYYASPQTPALEMLETFAAKGFMRCPVIDDGRIMGLITAKSLARWITEKHKGKVDINGTTLSEIIPYSDTSDWVVVAENTDIFSLAGRLKNSIKQGKYLQAVLVTKSGKPNDALTGIISPSDFPLLFELID